MSGKVFISHAREDEQRCAALLRTLDDWGVDYWYDRHEQGAGGPLSEKAQLALSETAVFLRVCTRFTQRSYWMSIESGAFLGLQADDHRAGRTGLRMLVNLIIDPAYVREPFDRTTTVFDASDRSQPGWVNNLRAALSLPPLDGMEAIMAVAGQISPAPPRINRRSAIGLGVAGAAALAVAGAGGAVLLASRIPSRPSAAATPTNTPPTHDPQLLWFFDTRDPNNVARVGITGWPATDGTTIFVGPNDGSLHALDAKTGKRVWIHPAAPGGDTVRGPAVGPGFVYGCAKGEGVYALAAASGTQQWAQTIDVLEHSVVVVHDNLIYVTNVGFAYPFIVVAEAATGKQLNTIEKTASNTPVTLSIPVIVDGILYVGDVEGYAYAFDALKGDVPPIWQADVGIAGAKNGNEVSSTVGVADGTAYFNSSNGSIYAFDARTGAKRWSRAIKSNVLSTPAASDGLVFVGTDDNKVYGLDAATGTVRWSYVTGGPVRSSPAVADGVVYVGSDDNNVYAIDAKTGKAVRIYKTAGKIVSRPLILNGTVYVTAQDGFVYAFKI